MVYGADEQLDNGKQIEEVELKKSLELFNHMTTSQGKEIIMSGWKASGIIEAIKKGSARLPSLNPFSDLDPRRR